MGQSLQRLIAHLIRKQGSGAGGSQKPLLQKVINGTIGFPAFHQAVGVDARIVQTLLFQSAQEDATHKINQEVVQSSKNKPHQDDGDGIGPKPNGPLHSPVPPASPLENSTPGKSYWSGPISICTEPRPWQVIAGSRFHSL